MVLEPNFSQTKNKSSEASLKKIKCLKENLKILKQQTKLNNEKNEKNRDILQSFSRSKADEKVSIHKKIGNKENIVSVNKKSVKSDCVNITDNVQCSETSPRFISKVNRDLIEYVKFREAYMKHLNHWQQIWLFTDNPIYEYEHSEGFENPTYNYLNAKEIFELEVKSRLRSFKSEIQNRFSYESLPSITAGSSLYLDQTFKYKQKLFQNYTSVMNLYESILDVNEAKQVTDVPNLVTSASIPAVLTDKCKKNNQFNRYYDSGLTSSPNSSDSGMHSDELLSRHNNISASATEEQLFNLKNISAKVSEDSLYSSVIGSKKSSDSLSSSNTKLDSTEDLNDENIKHVEQNELTLGWIRCCDEAGIYYWHKPSGTVTRKPPAIAPKNEVSQETAPKLPKKNFKIDEYSSFQQINELINGSCSDINTLSSPSSTSTSSTYESKHEIDANLYEIANDENEIQNSTSSASLFDVDNKTIASQSSNTISQNLANTVKTVQRFYVRSLGWVKIDENDLTPERSSKAVNRCINDLSRGHRDLNDVVASWGEGKDLYMDLEDNYLLLIDTNDNKVLNKQSITSIRVWGVGRDNGRDFAYVARDKQTKIHMCHVFRCDSAPAKDIANSLRDTCRKIINEKKLLKETISTTKRTLPKRPSFLPEIINEKNDFSRFKSISCNNNTEFKTSIPKSQTQTDDMKFISPMDEPKKTIKCKYLGSIIVSKPSGMDTLNEAIENIYMKSLEEYKRIKKQNKFKNKNQFKTSDYFEEKNEYEDEDDEDEDDDYENYRENSPSFDPLNTNRDKKLGHDVEVVVSPSTVSVKKINSTDGSYLVECRVRYLSFMGISNDVRICGFIVHCIDNSFKCHAFLCDISSATLCKTIEAACKLRYQKCLDAHPEAAQEANSNKTKQNSRFGYFGSQIKGMFDSIKPRNLFSSYNITELQK